MSKPLEIYTLSDSVGSNPVNVAKSALAQFTDYDCPIRNFSFIKSDKQLIDIVDLAAEKNAIIIFNFASIERSKRLEAYCQELEVDCFNLLTPLAELISEKTGLVPNQTPGANHQLDKEYFNRIKAMEFAVQYDDGQDPNGFLEADIVLLGISRTSKTPLSIFLANEGYKVANLPIMPESQIPSQIYEVDPSLIIGLTNDKDVLLNIRRERMRSYGLDSNSLYSTEERIEKELDYANNLYEELGCFTINVANKSIEETTAIIKKYLSTK